MELVGLPLYQFNSHGHQDLRYGYVYEDFQKLSMEAYKVL
tara:strand:- start:246 stop:365 length:120 start_codon:yes stop_codon:yes gene_type:complete